MQFKGVNKIVAIISICWSLYFICTVTREDAALRHSGWKSCHWLLCDWSYHWCDNYWYQALWRHHQTSRLRGVFLSKFKYHSLQRLIVWCRNISSFTCPIKTLYVIYFLKWFKDIVKLKDVCTQKYCTCIFTAEW